MSRSTALGALCGATVTLGSVVVLGWWAQGRLDPGPTLPFLSEVGGAALAGGALAAWWRPALARALGAATALAGLAVLGQAQGAAAGPVEGVPRAAIVLFGTGVGALLARTPLAAVSAALGLVTLALGAGALVAVLTRVTHPDGLLAPAPPLEAAAWLVLGAGLMLVHARPDRGGVLSSWRAPIGVGLASAMLSVLLFQALSAREDEQIQATLRGASARIRSDMAQELSARANTLSLLAAEWEDRMFRFRGPWESDVRLVLSRSPGLAAIQWISRDGEAFWTYPEDAERPPLELPEAAQARGRRIAVAAGPVRFEDGAWGFRILVPVSRTDAAQGWVAGLYRGQALFSGLASQIPEGWVVAIRSGGRELQRLPADDATWVAGLTETVPLQVFRGLPLGLTVGASPERVAAARSRLPHTVLGTGVLLSLILAVTLHLGLVSMGLARGLETRVARRTASLRRSNEALRRFASFLSHELRQPVNAQNLWADLLESDYADRLDERGRRSLSELRRLARRLGDLIDGQLALFAVSSAEADLEPVDLGEVLREVAGDLKPEIDRSGADVAWGPMPVVRADPRQMYQLFRNLLENAIKYRRPEAPPHVRIESGPAPDGDGVEIVHADRGRGFAPEAAERIFRLGERLEGGGASGDGLGLAVCRAIAERHGGSLTAEGHPGRGATFRIKLPANPSPVEPFHG